MGPANAVDCATADGMSERLPTTVTVVAETVQSRDTHVAHPGRLRVRHHE